MKRNNYLIVSVLSLLVLLLTVSGITAQGPTGGKRAPSAPAGAGARLTYQGRLTNSSGAPLNSTVNMVFKLYDDSSLLLWTSATRSVTPVNGLFTVYLGDGSDPNLGDVVLISAATVGVTVGSDPEMTPRQPLNTVVGHSNTDTGVYGSSNSFAGVYGSSNSFAGVYGGSNSFAGVEGFSNTSIGVYGATGSLADPGVYAQGAGPTGIALTIYNGGIQVSGAGSDGGTTSTTPVFMHKVLTASNLCTGKPYATVVDNPLTNGNEDAILIVTPNYRKSDASQSNVLGPTNFAPAVFYSVSGYCGAANNNKWVIYNMDLTAMRDNTFYNVMVIVP